METPGSRRILIVANRSVATPTMLEELRRRAESGPCELSLLMPNAAEGDAANWVLKLAVRLFEKAVGSSVEGLVAVGSDPFAAIEAAVAEGGYDEIIISTLPEQDSAWLEHDLPARVGALGLPVTVVTPAEPAAVR